MVIVIIRKWYFRKTMLTSTSTPHRPWNEYVQFSKLLTNVNEMKVEITLCNVENKNYYQFNYVFLSRNTATTPWIWINIKKFSCLYDSNIACYIKPGHRKRCTKHTRTASLKSLRPFSRKCDFVNITNMFKIIVECDT